MQNDIIKKQYNLLDSWSLFVEEGIYKSDNIDNAELKLWQQSKLIGADPFLEKIHIKKRIDVKNDIEIDSILNLWAYENGIALLIFNTDKILVSKGGFDIEHIQIEKGSFFDDKIIGLNALSISFKTHRFSCIQGAQHYVKALQYYSTRVYPIEIIGEKYYFLTLNHISNDTEELENEIKEKINEYIDRLSGNIISMKNEINYFDASVYEINSTGKIRTTKYSNLAIIVDGDNILSIFPLCDINTLFSGKKQIVSFKGNKKKKYLLSPISKNNQYSLNILIEKMEPVFDLFETYHKILNSNMSIFPNKNNLETGTNKRLKSLATSTLPVIFIIDDIIDQLILSSYISCLKVYDYNYYVDLDKSKGENIGVDNCIREIEKWKELDMDSCFHIFNINTISEKDMYETLNLVFKQSKSKVKYIIYSNNETYTKMYKDYPQIISSFKLNIMKVSQENISSIKNTFVSIDCDSNIKNRDKLSTKNLPEEKTYSLKQLERKAIVDALISVDYNISKACDILDISRSTLYRKIREYSIFPK